MPWVLAEDVHGSEKQVVLGVKTVVRGTEVLNMGGPVTIERIEAGM